jgi:multiple sugar transport system substrate-binding protein
VPESQFVTKLATAIRGRAVPDLVGVDDINGQLFMYRDTFTDLTEVVQDLDFLDSVSPGHLRLTTFEGRNYGLPYLGDLSRLFYNKELFEQAGVDPDDPPRDFAAVLSAAEAVQSLGGEIRGYSFAGNCPGCLGFTMLPNIWATGTDVFEGQIGEQTANVEDNPAVPAMLDLYREIWADGLAPGANRTESGATWGQDFLRGTIGIFPCSYGAIALAATPEILPKIGVTTLCGPDGGSSLFCGGDNFGIPRGSANASGAWAFIKFVTDLDQQSQLPTTGYTPIRSDALNDEYRRKFPLDVVALENLRKAYSPKTLVYNSAFNQVDGPFFQMFQKAVYDGDVDGGIELGQDGLSRLLEQAQL